MEEEIRQVTYLGLGLMLAGIVLTLISNFLRLSGDIVDLHNDKIVSNKQLQIHREFSIYDNTVVFGEDVVTALRQYYNEGIAIYVQNIGGSGRNLFVHSDIANVESLVDLHTLQRDFPIEDSYEAHTLYNIYTQTAIRNMPVPVKDELVANEVSAIKFIYEP